MDDKKLSDMTMTELETLKKQLEAARRNGEMSDDRYFSNGGYASATAEINAVASEIASRTQ